MSLVLVIGVTGGLGNAVSRLLIEQGHQVIGTVRDKTQIARVSSDLPGIADIFPLNLSDADETLRTLQENLQHKDLDGIIVCAAVAGYGPMETASLADFREFLEINTVSNLAIYQACMPTLRKTSGRLVLISSKSGKVAIPFFGLYQTSKFALEGLTDTLRQEAAEFNVQVVLVEPGGFDTAMVRSMGKKIVSSINALSSEEDQHYGHLYRQFKGGVEGATNLPTAREVAQTVLKAFTDEDPDPRYPVGKDTEFLFSKRLELTDRELDAFIRQL